MTEAEVRRATAHLLPAPKVKEDVWTYTEKGFARLNSQETRHTWTTNLVFQSGRLIQINLDAE